MSQNEGLHRNEVVYLVPCKEKHPTSQNSCVTKGQGDLMKLCLSNVGSLDLPLNAVGTKKILKKIKDKTHCSVKQVGQNELFKQNSSRYILSSGSYASHATDGSNKLSPSQHRNNIQSELPVKVSPDIFDSSSCIQMQDIDSATETILHDLFNSSNICAPLPGIPKLEMCSETKGQLSPKSVPTKITPGKTPCTSLDNNDALGTNTEGREIDRLEKNDIVSFSRVEDNNEDKSCMALLDDILNQSNFSPSKQSTVINENAEVIISCGSDTALHNSVSNVTFTDYSLLSNDLVWTQQKPKTTVLPLAPVTSDMGNLSDFFHSFQEYDPQYSCDDGLSLSDILDSKEKVCYSDTRTEIMDEIPCDQETSAGKSEDTALLSEVSKLEDLLFKTQSIEASAAFTTGKVLPNSNSDICSETELPYTSGFEQKFSKNTLKPAEFTDIDSIISDVGNILDEFQTSSKEKSSLAIGHVTDHELENLGLPCDSSSQTYSELSGSKVNQTTDMFLESLFPENFKTEKKNAGEVSDTNDLDLIFNSLGMSNKSKEFDSGKGNFSSSGTSIEPIGSTQVIGNPSVCNSYLNQPQTISTTTTPGIPKRVAFKVRPAGKTVRSFDKGRVSDKILPSIPTILRPNIVKDKCQRNRLKAHFNAGACTEQHQERIRTDKRYGNGDIDSNYLISCKYLAVTGESSSCTTTIQNTREEHQRSNLVLPVGKTGLSVAIPDTVKTNVISFLPTVSQISKSSRSSSSLPVIAVCEAKSCVVSGIPSNSNLMSNSSLIQCNRPKVKNANLIVASSTNTENLGNLNHVIQHSVLKTASEPTSVSSSTLIPFPGRIQVVEQISVPQAINSKPPLYIVVPANTQLLDKKTVHTTLPVTNIVAQSPNLEAKANSTHHFVEAGTKGTQTASRNFVKSAVQSIAPKGAIIKAVSSTKVFDGQVSGQIPEPVRITIRTKSKLPHPGECSSGSLSKDIAFVDSKKYKDYKRVINPALSSTPITAPSYSEKVHRNRALVSELKLHFPSVPESILQQLTIPPQALNRGYLTKHDLQNLHTQALKLHLSIIYNNHVSKCMIYKCEVCHNFVGQQEALRWSARGKFFKPRKPNRNLRSRRGQFKAKKTGRKCSRSRNVNPEEEDPTYEPPLSYFKSWKRKTDNLWCNRQPLKISRVENNLPTGSLTSCCILLKNMQKTERLNQEFKMSLRRSVSEPNVTQSKKQQFTSNKRYCQDDLIVSYDTVWDRHQDKSDTKAMFSEDSDRSIRGLQSVFEESRIADTRNSEFTSGRVSICKPSCLLHFGREYDNGTTLQQWNFDCKSQCCSAAPVKPECSVAVNLPGPVVGYPYSTNSSSEPQGTLQPVSLGNELQFSPALYLEKGCGCKESCRKMQCPCARAGVLCRTGLACSCKNCDNPLNVLHQFELDVLLSRVDECLMQNLYSFEISDLCKLLMSEVVLPCCQANSKLQHIIPSTVICKCCGNAVSYSWCTQNVHLQTVFPRNHCIICCACKPTLHIHCQNCQQCTPSASQGTCTECGLAKIFAV